VKYITLSSAGLIKKTNDEAIEVGSKTINDLGKNKRLYYLILASDASSDKKTVLTSNYLVDYVKNEILNVQVTSGDDYFRDLLFEIFEKAYKNLKNKITLDSDEKYADLAIFLSEGSTGYVAVMGDIKSYLYRPILAKVQDVALSSKLFILHNDEDSLIKRTEQEKNRWDKVAGQLKLNVLSKSIGIQKNLKPEYISLALHKDDKILICTKGFFQHFDRNEIEKQLSSDEHIEDIGKNLDTALFFKGAPHNYSLALWHCVAPTPHPLRVSSHKSISGINWKKTLKPIAIIAGTIISAWILFMFASKIRDFAKVNRQIEENSKLHTENQKDIEIIQEKEAEPAVEKTPKTTPQATPVEKPEQRINIVLADENISPVNSEEKNKAFENLYNKVEKKFKELEFAYPRPGVTQQSHLIALENLLFDIKLEQFHGKNPDYKKQIQSLDKKFAEIQNKYSATEDEEE
jgi:serine/threonine protein phosphatase PrpC